MRRQFSAKTLRMSIFFSTLIDSNPLFIAVGRPNPDQCFGKSTLKSKSASTVKQGCYVIFWRCALIVKQPLTQWGWTCMNHVSNVKAIWHVEYKYSVTYINNADKVECVDCHPHEVISKAIQNLMCTIEYNIGRQGHTRGVTGIFFWEGKVIFPEFFPGRKFPFW